MNTKTIVSGFELPRRMSWPLKYPEEVQMITAKTKRELISLVYQNILDVDDREIKLMEIEDMTQAEGIDMLYQIFSRG